MGIRRGVAMAALCVTACPAAAKVLGASAPSAEISPKLHPASHKVFYMRDYPDDLHPRPLHDFSHPFPIVQDSEDYDKDFVKDENADGGEWKLQERYDKLRGRLVHARDIAEKMQDKEYAASRTLRNMQSKEKEARSRAEAAMEAKIKAEAKAAEKLKQAEGKYDQSLNKTVGQYGVGNQTEVVSAEEKDFAKCQKELAEARKKLKELQDEREKAEAAMNQAKEKKEDMDDEAMDYEKKEAAAESVVADDTAKHKQAHDHFEKAEEQMHSNQADFVKAEARLRKFRQQKVDPGGGVYEVKSAAARRFPSSHAALAAAAPTLALLVLGAI